MAFLAHPYFDESDAEPWIDMPFDGDTATGHATDALASAIQRDFQAITSLVLSRLRECMPADWRAECPHPLLNEVSYCPAGDTSARIFVEYAFRPNGAEPSHHNDIWWAIVLCPYFSGNPVTQRVDYTIEHFGWSID